jgi:hypothetical protein
MDHLKPFQFQKGMEKTGGRKPGIKNRIAHKFLRDLEIEWRKSGADCLKIMAKEDPGGLAKIVASLLPREFESDAPTSITIVTGVHRAGDAVPVITQRPVPPALGDDV